MTPKELQAWFTKPGTAEIELSETLDMRGVVLKGAGKTIRGGKLIRARIIPTDCTFDGVAFDSAPLPGEAYFQSIACYADGAANTVWRSCSFEGGGPGQGTGLRVNGCNGVTVRSCAFTDQMMGLVSDKTTDLVAVENTFDRISDNAIATSGCDGVLIKANIISGVKAWTDPKTGIVAHTDAIQSWTSVTRDGTGKALKWHPCLNYTVTDNIIIQGDGDGNQGIFHRSRSVVQAKDVVDFETTRARHWLIARNLIYGWSHNNSIYMIEGGDDVTIEGNISVSPIDEPAIKWVMLENVTNATVRNNVADAFYSKTGPSTYVDMFTNPHGVDFVNNARTKDVAGLIPDLGKRALATEAWLRLQVGGVRLLVG